MPESAAVANCPATFDAKKDDLNPAPAKLSKNSVKVGSMLPL